MGQWSPVLSVTVADPFSRYVLAIDAMPSTHMQSARNAFERVFREYGVPRQLITDNGTPFCSAHSLGGLAPMALSSMKAISMKAIVKDGPLLY